MKTEQAEVESLWKEFWEPIFASALKDEGKSLMEQIKNELYDFKLVMDRAPIVYDHVTGGMASKLLTNANVICSLADEHYSQVHIGTEERQSICLCGHAKSDHKGRNCDCLAYADEERGVFCACMKFDPSIPDKSGDKYPVDLGRLIKALPSDVNKKVSLHDLKRICDNYNNPSIKEAPLKRR